MTTPAPASPPHGRLARFLDGWTHPSILAATGLSFAAGFAQFGAASTLGDVAREFGEVSDAAVSIAEQAGLSGTTLGTGLAIIRLASLGGLLLSALADTVGRRRVILWCSAGGLAVTALAAASPGYWWFVALFALARPMLSANNAIAGVIAAEETATAARAKAMALITAGYGVGAGTTAVVRTLLGEGAGFRPVFALAVVPLLCVPLLGRAIREPERFTEAVASAGRRARAPLGDVLRNGLARTTAVLFVVTFSIAFVTGPVNALLFLYGENILGVSTAATAWAVVAAGPCGLVGLVVGRWAADTIGRRHTAVAMQILTGITAAITYAGTSSALFAGYLSSIVAASAFAPATGAMAAELFPTRVRSTAAGWLTVAGVLGAVGGLITFGFAADLFDSFAPAALVIAAPSVLCAPLFWLLRETREGELEDAEDAGAAHA